MTFCIVCGINSKHSDIFFLKGGYILKIITKLYVTCNDDTTSFCYKSYNNIGCDDDEEEVDSDDMEYTEDAIDYINL